MAQEASSSSDNEILTQDDNEVLAEEEVLAGENEGYLIPLGDALRSVRHRLGWTIGFAAAELGISERYLSQLEAQMRTPGEELLREIEEVYGIELDRLEARDWMDRVPPRFDIDTGMLWIGWMPIQISECDNEALACALGSTIRTMRALPDHEPVYLRSTDLDVLAPLFDLNDRLLDFQLMRYLGLTWFESDELIKGMQAERRSMRTAEGAAA